MVPEVWLPLCRAALKEAFTHWFKVAPGRGLPQDQWGLALFMASCGSAWRYHDILVQPKRDRWAALRFFRKLLHTAGRTPRVIITDKLRSYTAAKRRILPEVEHRQSRYLNNRAENSHQPTRIRERQRKRFQSPEQAQNFLSTFESINANFRFCRHLLSAACHRRRLTHALQLWCATAFVLALP